MNRNEDTELLAMLEEMIRKKREEIRGLNKLIGSMEHPEDNPNGGESNESTANTQTGKSED
jgi:hypothetical protein